MPGPSAKTLLHWKSRKRGILDVFGHTARLDPPSTPPSGRPAFRSSGCCCLPRILPVPPASRRCVAAALPLPARQALAQRATRPNIVQMLTSRHITDLAWAYATLNVRHAELMDALVERALSPDVLPHFWAVVRSLVFRGACTSLPLPPVERPGLTRSRVDSALAGS